MAYITQTDLENALGTNAVRALFDDNGDSTADAAPVAAAIAFADAKVDGFLRTEYTGPFPLQTTPDLVKFAAIDWGIFYAVRRRAEVAKAIGLEPPSVHQERALEQMKRFVDAVEKLDPTVGTPGNIGGLVIDGAARLVTDSPDGTSNSGDF